MANVRGTQQGNQGVVLDGYFPIHQTVVDRYVPVHQPVYSALAKPLFICICSRLTLMI